MRRYVVGALILMTCGYGSMDARLPAFMTTVAHLPVNAIGVVFFLNTLVIVLGQVFVLHRIEGRSRSRLMAVVATIWGSFWVVVARSRRACRRSPRDRDRARLRRLRRRRDDPCRRSGLAGQRVLAPHLRRRYNAVAGLIWGVAGAWAGDRGHRIGGGWGVAWALTLTAGCVLAAFVLSSLRGPSRPRGRAHASPVLAGSEVRG